MLREMASTQMLQSLAPKTLLIVLLQFVGGLESLFARYLTRRSQPSYLKLRIRVGISRTAKARISTVVKRTIRNPEMSNELFIHTLDRGFVVKTPREVGLTVHMS